MLIFSCCERWPLISERYSFSAIETASSKINMPFVDFFAGDAQRRREADGAFAAAQQQQPALKGQVDDPVAQMLVGVAPAAIL